MGRSHCTGSKLARKLKTLRERDGDNCWLCGEPMNFGPAKPKNKGQKWRVSLDRLDPKGSYRNENVKLAHSGCNSIRGSVDVQHLPAYFVVRAFVVFAQKVRAMKKRETTRAYFQAGGKPNGHFGMPKWLQAELTNQVNNSGSGGDVNKI